jgi:hypothetical protein
MDISKFKRASASGLGPGNRTWLVVGDPARLQDLEQWVGLAGDTGRGWEGGRVAPGRRVALKA